VGIVTEVVRLVFSDQPDRIIERDQDLLLAPPHPNPFPVKLWHDHEPLAVESCHHCVCVIVSSASVRRAIKFASSPLKLTVMTFTAERMWPPKVVAMANA